MASGARCTMLWGPRPVAPGRREMLTACQRAWFEDVRGAPRSLAKDRPHVVNYVHVEQFDQAIEVVKSNESNHKLIHFVEK